MGYPSMFAGFARSQLRLARRKTFTPTTWESAANRLKYTQGTDHKQT